MPCLLVLSRWATPGSDRCTAASCPAAAAAAPIERAIMVATQGWALQPPPALPPVIFLDVDGVLHSQAADAIHFSPECMANLRLIVEHTGAVIVLSSFWQREASSRAEVNEALRRWGIPNFVAVTADCNPGSGEERRAREIMSWVRNHPEACAAGWVAIDDLDLMAVAPPPSFVPVMSRSHFVRTAANTGLTQADAARAIQALGGPNAGAPALPPVMSNAAEPFSAVALKEQEDRRTGHQAWRSDARYGR